MQKITPFLWFDHQAEEAAKYYCGIFSRSKIVRVTRYGPAGPGPAGSVMTVDFKLEGQRFIALNGGPSHKFNPALSLVVKCKNQKELDGYWAKLGRGGKPVACGWLEDKFGLSWQVVPEGMDKLFGDKDQAKVERTMQAMLKMVKLDLKKLRKAAKG
jgi:predicted 3-demethylubiquinone-9 3-methyltransferase (glyoxalase superfamily)